MTTTTKTFRIIGTEIETGETFVASEGLTWNAAENFRLTVAIVNQDIRYTIVEENPEIHPDVLAATYS